MEKSRLRRCRRSSMVALRLPTNSWPQTLPRRASGLGRAHFDRLCRNSFPHHAAQMLERGPRLPGSEVTSASDCLNGSLVYLPALAAMAVVGGLLAAREASGYPLHPLGGIDLRHLGDVPLPRPCDLRRLPDPRAQNRHPFRLAAVEWAGAFPPPQSEP